MACPWWDDDDKHVIRSRPVVVENKGKGREQQIGKSLAQPKVKNHVEPKTETKGINHTGKMKEGKQLQKSYQRVYGKGYATGYEKGFEHGYGSGYDHGYDHGYGTSSVSNYGDGYSGQYSSRYSEHVEHEVVDHHCIGYIGTCWVIEDSD